MAYKDKYATDADIKGVSDLLDDNKYQWGSGDQVGIAVKAFKDTYGRVPTTAELNETLSLNAGDINGYVAGKKLQEDNTPDKIAKKQNDQYLADAPKHFDEVSQQFKNLLGRDASQDELNHFGSLLASGTTDAYGLQTFLQQQPEFQQSQNKKFQGDLSGQLSGYDKEYFDKSILPSIQEAYAKQGRSFDSSAFQNAATNAAQAQNTQRQSFLGNLSAQQYGNTQANAYNDYARQVANQQAQTNAGIQGQYAGVQNSIGRQQQFNDFNMQQAAYNQYLAKYGKRGPGIMDYANLALNGVKAGAQAYSASQSGAGGSY